MRNAAADAADAFPPPPPPVLEPVMRTFEHGEVVKVIGLSSRPDLSGRIAKVLGYDATCGRYGVSIDGESPMRIKESNLSSLDAVECSFRGGFNILGGPRCVWCREPSHLDWACKCEAGFCSEACRAVSRKNGHAFLCKKGIAFIEYAPPPTNRRLMVVTLPRRARVTTVDSARAFFGRGGADLSPGSVLACAHVGGPAEDFMTFRFATKFMISESSVELGLGMLKLLFNKLALCTVAVRDAIHPPNGRRANDPCIPRRTISLSIVALDKTVEHVVVAYEDPTVHPSGVQERVAIRSAVHETGLGAELEGRPVTLLTPTCVHAFVYGADSVGVSMVDPGPPGAAPGGIAALFSSKRSLTNCVRLESYDAARGEWTVQPMRWDMQTQAWAEHKKKGPRVVDKSDVCVDRVCVRGFPDLWKTTFVPGSTADDVALTAYCTLPMQQRETTPIIIHEGGKAREYRLPTTGFVMLPAPPAPFRTNELAEALRSTGMTVIVRASPESAEYRELVAFVGRIDMEPSSTAVFVERPRNPTGFRALQCLLSCTGRAATIHEAAWICFRGGDGRNGESMWVAGRSCHNLDAARRMILDMTEEHECAICLEPLIDGASRPLGCGHSYHLQCMFDAGKKDQSIEQNCALCRAPFRMNFLKNEHGLQNYEDVADFEASRAWGFARLGFDDGCVPDLRGV